MRRAAILLSLAVLCLAGRPAWAGTFFDKHRERPTWEALRRQWGAICDLREKLAPDESFERVLAAEVQAISDAYEPPDRDERVDVGAAPQQRWIQDRSAPDMLINLAVALVPERKAPLDALLVGFITDEKEDWSLRWLAAGIGAHFGLKGTINAAERICADDTRDGNLRIGFLYHMFRQSDGAEDGFLERVAKGEVTQNQRLIEGANELIGNVAKAKKLRRANPEELLQTWLGLIDAGDGQLILRLYDRPCYWAPEGRYDDEESARVLKLHKMFEVQDILRRHLESGIKWTDPAGREWVRIYDTAASRSEWTVIYDTAGFRPDGWEVVVRKEHGLWYLRRVSLAVSWGHDVIGVID